MKIDETKYQYFRELEQDNLYFTNRGCDVKGSVKIPLTWINRIMNWSGACTDPLEREDFYKNPRAMFVALDLIYRMLDSVNSDKLGTEVE